MREPHVIVVKHPIGGLNAEELVEREELNHEDLERLLGPAAVAEVVATAEVEAGDEGMAEVEEAAADRD